MHARARRRLSRPSSVATPSSPPCARARPRARRERAGRAHRRRGGRRQVAPPPRHDRRGARAAGSSCCGAPSFEADASIPYAPLLDLVRLFAETASPALVAHVLAPAAAELVALFPELRPIFPTRPRAPATDPETDKRRLFHAFARRRSRCSRTRSRCSSRSRTCTGATTRRSTSIFHLARSHASQPVRHRAHLPQRRGRRRGSRG